MPSKNIITPILPGKIYHIFNRGNNYENVFRSQDDYKFFLKRFKYHLKGICEIYSFALLPNHYHFLIRINDDVEGNTFSEKLKLLVQEYTFRINGIHGRNGNLFLKPYRRLEITSDEYYKRLVFYIHFNPQKHKICKDFKKYEFSSYLSIISTLPTNVNRKAVLDWFGGKNEFIEYHNYLYGEKIIERLIIE